MGFLQLNLSEKNAQQELPACRLFPLAAVITPNLAEAAALLGARKISSIEDMKAAARDLHALGPQYVLVKGGHLEQGRTGPSGACRVSNLLRSQVNTSTVDCLRAFHGFSHLHTALSLLPCYFQYE